LNQSFITFKEAERARVSLKMKLSQYHWYKGSSVSGNQGEYNIIIHVSQEINDSIRKVIPTVVDNVFVKTEVSL